MKIFINDKKNIEPEVIVNGDKDSDIVNRIISTLEELNTSPNGKNILLKDEEGHVIRELGEVIYIYAIKNKSIVRIDCEEYECKLKLYEFEELKNYGFIRISKSTVINVKYLDRIQIEFSGNFTITMHNKEKLTLSRSYAKEFKKYLKEVL